MQEWETDYYEEGEGCCLRCPNSHKGCLCFECKCTQCYWYSSPQQTGDCKGWCDKVNELKEERKEEYKRELQRIEDEKWEKNLILKKINEKIEKEIKGRKEIPNYYVCQRCKREFCSEGEFSIIQYKEPLCSICKLEVENGARTN